MKVKFSIFFSLALFSGMMDRASAVEFLFGDFTCDDLGTTISIIDYPNEAVGPVVIPQSIERGGIQKPVTVIEVVAFDDSVGITSVTIPSSVTSVGSDAFARCTALTSVTLPSSLTSIGANAFRDCSALTSITLPIGLSVIEESLLEGCSSLVTLEIPGGVTAIGPRAFAQCDGLVSLSIPEGVTTISNSTFEGCNLLTRVSLPPSVNQIDNFAFADCDSMVTFTIPSTVTVMGNSVFDACGLLESVFFMGDAPAMGDTVFDNQSNNPNLRIYFFDGKSGFTAPSWLPIENQPPYASINMGSENPMAPWLILNDLPANSNPQDDANGDGVNLLMAYALNLDPSKNLSGSLPKPVLGNNQMSMSFYADSPGITYRVETCTDLMSWTDVGVTLSLPNSFQIVTASVDLSGSQRFMRLVVEK
jgi:BspA type Leucine rich repeat region (6 copies)